MSLHGRIELTADGTTEMVSEYRQFMFGDIPPHKAYMWRIVEDNMPEYDSFYYNVLGPTAQIQPDKIVFYYEVVPKSQESFTMLVKEEAARRILGVYPLWKQSSIVMDKITLLDTPNRTIEQEAKLAEASTAIEWIQAIRLKSDEIETMDPLPKNYTDDEYWIV